MNKFNLHDKDIQTEGNAINAINTTISAMKNALKGEAYKGDTTLTVEVHNTFNRLAKLIIKYDIDLTDKRLLPQHSDTLVYLQQLVDYKRARTTT